MSTVDSSIRCPQCGRWACQTFDCRVSSWDIGCSYCGYSEFRGPDFRTESGGGKWVHEINPGYGVLAIQSPHPLGVVTVWRCSDEAEFLKLLAEFDKIDRDTYVWAEVTRWRADTNDNEAVRSYLRDGHTAPTFHLGGEEAKD